MRLLYCLLAGLALGACDRNEDVPQADTEAPVDAAAVTYLALGDSYTIGEGLAAPQTFPYQLADSLSARGQTVDEVTVIARTGWRADVLLAAIDSADTGPPPNLVTVLIGVNDQYQGRTAESFRQNFLLVLDRAEGLAAGGREDVLVVTIPDYSATPFVAGRDTAQIRRGIEAFNAVIAAEAGARGIRVADVYAVSKAARDNPGGLLVDDGLHPSADQYRQWVGEILESLKAGG